MDVAHSLPASVSIAVSPFTTVCSGTIVDFTAIPVNGGIPSYQWYLNGTPVGNNSDTYTNNALSDGDSVYCIMTSSLTCVTGSPALSNTIIMTVLPSPVVDLGPDTTICDDQSILLDAGSGFVSYLWTGGSINQTLLVDGATIGTGSWSFIVEVSDTNNCEAADTIIVTVTTCTGLSDNSNNPMIFCYPNPVHGVLSVVINTGSGENIELYLANIYGQIVYARQIGKEKAGEIQRIDVTGFAAGVYVIGFRISERSYYQKLIIE